MTSAVRRRFLFNFNIITSELTRRAEAVGCSALLCLVLRFELYDSCYSRFPRLSRPESGREVRDDVDHGVREAVKAAIAAISSTVSLATTPFICGLNSPARAPLW
jgi:hypothetical protein